MKPWLNINFRCDKYYPHIGLWAVAVIVFGAIFESKATPIGLIQGEAKINPSEFSSPFENKKVTVEGIIHSTLSWKESSGRKVYGLYLQNLPNRSDQNPATSDGLFVFLGKYKNLYDGKSQIKCKLGLYVTLVGTIKEFYGNTQLVNPRVKRVNGELPDWKTRLETVDINPPSDNESAAFYWEKVEGMRCRIAKGAVVTGPSKTVGGGAENYVWVIHPNHKVALRDNYLTQRAFRDAHPLDDNPGKFFDNENGYRILLSSKSLLSAKNEYINPASSLDTLENDVFGAVDYSYGNYKVVVSENPEWVKPSIGVGFNDAPKNPNTWSVATYNVENFYDYRNDSSDPCDFLGDRGNKWIRPPFNYVPKSNPEYSKKVKSITLDITEKLSLPDVVMMQEIEDQDMDFVSLGGIKHVNGDGQPDILQDLQESILRSSGVSYISGSIREGADYRGITCGFLVRSDRWAWHYGPEISSLFEKMDSSLPYSARVSGVNLSNTSGPSIVAINGHYQNQKSGDKLPIYSRALQIGVLEPKLKKPNQVPRLYVLNNHFSSIPNQRIERRTYQANLLAAVARFIEKSDPSAGIIMGGDLNVFPEPDDGTPEKPSKQLRGLYELNWQTANKVILKNQPELAYTYIYQGQAQTLDHLFLSPSLENHLNSARIIHINSDYPDHPATYRSSDHDPVIVYFNN